MISHAHTQDQKPTQNPQLSDSHHLITQIQFQQKSQLSKTSSRRLKEKPAQTIEVLSDQEEQNIINQVFFEQVFNTKVQQAKLTRSKYNILRVLYIELNFHGLSEKNKQKKFDTMVKAYIYKNLKTSKGEPFDIRNSYFFDKLVSKPGTSLNFNLNDEFVENEYLLYGCDLMSQTHVQKMFQAYGPTIKWVNSSHCKLTFYQKIKGWEAIINNCRDEQLLRKDVLSNLKVESMMGNLQLESDSEMDIQPQNKYNEEYMKMQKFKREYHLVRSNFFLTEDYVELMPYYELGFKRRLMIRNLTRAEQILGYDINLDSKQKKSTKSKSKQKNQQKGKEDSEFKKYLRVKQALWKQIEHSPLVKPEYEKINQQMQREQEISRFGRRSKPSIHTSSNNFDKNRPRQRDYRTNNYQMVYSDRNSQRSNQFNLEQFPRNRSRDYQRNPQFSNKNKRGSFRTHLDTVYGKRTCKWDMIEREFDSYIQQRDGLRIIQNPHQYLEPEFIDKSTGIHFYRNPFYNQPQSYNPTNYHQANQYMQNNQKHHQEQFYFPDQSISSNDQSGYEYEGNVKNKFRAGNYPTDYNHHGKSINFHQKKKKMELILEEQFNKYRAQRQLANSGQNTLKLNDQPNQACGRGFSEIRQILPQTKPVQYYDAPVLFQQDPNLSIISEQKQRLKAQKEGLTTHHNLEKILDQINQQETEQRSSHSTYQPFQSRGTFDQNEDDSEDLEFMLRERQKKLLSPDVKLESNTQNYQKVLTSQAGYIEEKIKQENIPNWFKTSIHEVESIDPSIISSRFEHEKNTLQGSQANQYNIKMRNSQVEFSKTQSRKKSHPRKIKTENQTAKKDKTIFI